LKWRDLLSYGKDALSAVSDLIDDKDFRNNLGKAGGVLALVSVALEVTDKVYDQLQTPKEKVYNRLSKYVLKIMNESLKDLKSDSYIDRKTMEQRMEESFNNVTDSIALDNWNFYLPNHPVTVKFKEKIRPMNNFRLGSLVWYNVWIM
jgi:hypothetical protein